MLVYLLWVLLVLAGLLGWGELAGKLLRLNPISNRSAVSLILGVAVEGFVASLCAEIGFGSPRAWISLQIVGGLTFTAFSAARVKIATFSSLKAVWLRWATSVMAFGVVLFASLHQTWIRPWNPCDDDPAYLYLARRFWLIGDIHEPFNNRRLTSPGLFSFLQAIVMGPFKEGTLHMADEMLGGVLLLFTVWRLRFSGRIFAAGLGLVSILLVSHQFFGGANSSPTFFLFAVSVAILPILPADALTPQETRANGLLFGIGTSVLMLCRPYMIVVQGLVVLALLCTVHGYRTRRFILSMVGGAFGTALPWLVLGMSDSNSPLFPFVRGNLARNFPFDGHIDKVSIGPHVVNSVRDIGGSPWMTMALVVVVLVGLVARLEREEDKVRVEYVRFTVLMILLMVGYYVFFAVSVRRTGPAAWFPRFWAPSLAVPAVLALLKVRDTNHLHTKSVGVVALIAPLMLFAPTMTGTWDTAKSILTSSTNGQLTSLVREERYPAAEPVYSSISDGIPVGARVLVAVQLPHMLLSTRYTIESLDLAGSTVEKGDFPFFTDSERKRQWLSDSGFDYVVVTRAASNSCLFGETSWKSNIGKDNTYEDWTKYVLDWIQFAEHLANGSPLVVREAGDLVLVKLN